MDKNFDKKKEEESLNYLQSNFIGGGDNNIDNIQRVDTSYLDNTPDNTYMQVPLEILPCGIFYKKGTKISIRSANVQEVQAYSVVDNNNYLDVTEKMNQLLSTCIKFILPNGQNGSYKDVKDGDRLYLIFMIRELTFPGGKNLSKDVACKNCNHEFKIELRATSSEKVAKSFVNYNMPEKLEKFFSIQERVFIFTINDVDYKLAPPTIGIQEALFGDIKTKTQSDKNINVSFLKIASCMLYDRINITEAGIKEKENEFKRMDMKTFQILNSAINQMLFGIKELSSVCPQCGLEVHTEMTFPDGAANIFVISNVIDEYFG